MYEDYTRQALPLKGDRELLASAICVFYSNNQFIIENILKIDDANYSWYELIDKTSGEIIRSYKGDHNEKLRHENRKLVFFAG